MSWSSPTLLFPIARFWRKLLLTLEMIKFEHSVFALPFALTGALLAFREDRYTTSSLGSKVFWIILAMVSARSAAMAFNRVVDAEIDARNPRTASRHLPAGKLTRTFAWLFTAVACVVFTLAAGLLNPLCFQLAPLALAVILGYSFTKRFTAFAHIVLGIALGIAPAAAWIAIGGSLDTRILWLSLAVTLWTAGFDIIYSCQDYEFDRESGLFSIPSRLGISQALWISRLLHSAMLLALAALVCVFELHALGWTGVAAVAALLAWEHRLVRAGDLSRIDAAFFTTNGWISVLFFVFVAADLAVDRYLSYAV